MFLQFLEFLYPALLATVVLTAIHGWLGIQVVERGLVFPALALAQLAALGTAGSIRLGFSPYLGAFVLTVAGAALFASPVWRGLPARATRPPERGLGSPRHTRETLVAIIFAAAAAGTLLLLGGGQLAGDLLSVRVRTTALIAVVYIAVAAASVFVRRGPAESRPLHLFLLLAVVFTSSVAIADVPLVFTYLVAPGILSRRFVIAWPLAILLSAAGIGLAFKFDLPTAPTVVCTIGVVLAVVAGVRLKIRA